MKYLALFFLKLYQKLLSPLLHLVVGTGHACRYSPTCSEFAKIHIQQEGLLKGGAKSFLRILYCQPFVETLPSFLQ